MKDKFLVLAFIALIFLSHNLNAQENTVVLSNDDAEFTINLTTGSLIQIKDLKENINFLDKPSGLAYSTNRTWYDNYNVPSSANAVLIENTPTKIVFQKNIEDFIIIYKYIVTKNRLDWTTEIKYAGNSVVNDFVVRMFFGLNESVLNDYTMNPTSHEDLNSYESYKNIEEKSLYLAPNSLYHTYFNNTKSGLLILLKDPIIKSIIDSSVANLFRIDKENKIPLSYWLEHLYFDNVNKEQTIKFSIVIDKNIDNAKRKAFDLVERDNDRIKGNWLIMGLGITNDDIIKLKQNNYKVIQIHGWYPKIGVYPTSGNWINPYGYEVSVEEINGIIKKIQDNGMVAFLYFNAAEMQKDEAIINYPEYISVDKDGNYYKPDGVWGNSLAEYERSYVMSLRGKYKDDMLRTLSSLLETYDANGIFIDRNDLQATADYNLYAPKKYFDINSEKPFTDQGYNDFIKEASELIHNKNKFVILNLIRTMDYASYADGTSIDASSIKGAENLYASSLGKPFYVMPAQEIYQDKNKLNEFYFELNKKLLTNYNVFYGSGLGNVGMGNISDTVSPQLNNDKENSNITEENSKAESKTSPNQQPESKTSPNQQPESKTSPNQQPELKEKLINNKIYFISIFLGILIITVLVFKIIKSYKKIKEETR